MSRAGAVTSFIDTSVSVGRTGGEHVHADVSRPATLPLQTGHTLKAASLFSGIGAPEVAMPHWNWLWHAEIEPFPSAVMAARHPGSVNLGDVTAPDFVERALDVGRPDVLVFGSPCQSFSVAGKRLGLDDPRGNLALVALALAERLRPSWILFENVPGLFSSYSGSELAECEVREGPLGGQASGEESRDFAAFLSRLRECGYLGCWRVLDAQFAGVPQRRRRVFFVGHLGDWRPAAAVLFEPASLQGHPAPGREAREDIARPLAAGAPSGSGYRNDCDTAENLIAHTLNAKGGSGRIDGESETFVVAPPITSNPYGDHESREGLLVTHSLRAGGFDASEDGTGRGTPLVPVAFQENLRSEVRLTNTVGALSTGGGKPGQGYPAVAYGIGSDAVDRSGEGAVGNAAERAGLNIVADCQPSLRARPNNSVATTAAVRRLLPVECEKLQGFWPGYTAITYRGKPAADGPRYRALGNAMCVSVVRWLLARLERQHAQHVARAA